MSQKTIAPVLFFFAIFAFPVFSDSALTQEQVEVAEIRFKISKDKTREQALQKRIMVKPDTVYATLIDLQNAVDRDVQELKNLKLFEDVRADVYFIPGSRNRYEVTYIIEEGFNFIPAPMLLYNSNYGGFQIFYAQIWGNMFGTLANWFSIFNLTLRDDGSGNVEIGPWFFMPIISDIRMGSWSMTIGVSQTHDEFSRYNGAELVSKYKYNKSRLFFRFLRKFGDKRQFWYTIGPGISGNYDYVDIAGLGGYNRKLFEGEITQSLFYNTVDYNNNARQGWKVGATTVLRMVNNDFHWKPEMDLKLEAGPYLAWGKNDWFSYYPRLLLFTTINGVTGELGKYVRGIPDDSMDGNLAIYMNQTLGFRLWHWKKVWDLQFHPWFDMAIASGGTRPLRGWTDVRKSVGTDVLLFFDKIPNFSLRFSWGVDLDPDLVWGDKNKTEFIVQYAHTY